MRQVCLIQFRAHHSGQQEADQAHATRFSGMAKLTLLVPHVVIASFLVLLVTHGARYANIREALSRAAPLAEPADARHCAKSSSNAHCFLGTILWCMIQIRCHQSDKILHGP